MNLRELVYESHEQAKRKGWYENPDGSKRNIPELLCLIHSEVSEALEAYRNSEPTLWLGEKGKPEGLLAELADVVIRIGDMCGYLELDLERAVQQKLAFNETRPHRHGGKRI